MQRPRPSMRWAAPRQSKCSSEFGVGGPQLPDRRHLTSMTHQRGHLIGMIHQPQQGGEDERDKEYAPGHALLTRGRRALACCLHDARLISQMRDQVVIPARDLCLQRKRIELAVCLSIQATAMTVAARKRRTVATLRGSQNLRRATAR